MTHPKSRPKGPNEVFFRAADEIPAAGFGALLFSYVTDPALNLVHLDLDKINDVWRRHRWYQRSPDVTSYTHDLPFDGEPERIRSLIAVITNPDDPKDPMRKAGLPPIRVGFSNGSLEFPDARHRVTLLTAAGYRSIPALVPADVVVEVVSRLGAEALDPRIKICEFETHDDQMGFAYGWPTGWADEVEDDDGEPVVAPGI